MPIFTSHSYPDDPMYDGREFYLGTLRANSKIVHTRRVHPREDNAKQVYYLMSGGLYSYCGRRLSPDTHIPPTIALTEHKSHMLCTVCGTAYFADDES